MDVSGSGTTADIYQRLKFHPYQAITQTFEHAKKKNSHRSQSFSVFKHPAFVLPSTK
jgi:hypothetical protein